jgi:hypothetical protein
MSHDDASFMQEGLLFPINDPNGLGPVASIQCPILDRLGDMFHDNVL